MDLLADGAALRHRRDHGLAEVLRVRAREADPFDPVDRIAGAEELAELGCDLGAQVTSPRIDVLAEQRDLLDAVGREPRDLRDDLTGPPALLAPADSRDDAVRALGVAAHRDLHPGAERALAVHRQVACEVLVRTEPASRRLAAGADPFAEVRDRAWAERNVDLRVELEDPLPLRFRVAAADGDNELGVLPLPCAGVAEVGGQFRVRLLADRAGVEDEHVGILGRGRLAEPERLEHALDPLRVVGVHLAAERGHVVPAHRRDRTRPTSRSRSLCSRGSRSP